MQDDHVVPIYHTDDPTGELGREGWTRKKKENPQTGKPEESKHLWHGRLSQTQE